MIKLSNLQLLVILSAILSLGSLVFLWIRSFSFGKFRDLSVPQSNGLKGIIYAFGRGMMPWEKESAAKHLPTYLGGVVYHCALLSALLYIFWDMFGFPEPLYIITPLRLIWLMGLIAGLALLSKRILKPELRRLSCPDDFAANIFSDLFLAIVILSTIDSGWRNILYIYAVLLFLYIPLGKIRHCFFFFTTRILFGKFFGRRGIYPGRRREIEI